MLWYFMFLNEKEEFYRKILTMQKDVDDNDQITDTRI